MFKAMLQFMIHVLLSQLKCFRPTEVSIHILYKYRKALGKLAEGELLNSSYLYARQYGGFIFLQILLKIVDLIQYNPAYKPAFFNPKNLK